MHSPDLNVADSSIDFGGLVLGIPELEGPEVFMVILRANSEVISSSEDFSGTAVLLRRKEALFQNEHLEEIAAYCAKHIQKLIFERGSGVQIQALASLAAAAVSLLSERSRR